MTFDTFTIYYNKARNGNAFVVSEVFNIASGGTANVHLKNPADSEKEFWITIASVSSDVPYIAKVHDDFSDLSGGTGLTIQNVLLDTDNEADEGVGIANENVTYTSTSNHAVGVGGGGIKETIGAASEHTPIIIQSGREIVLEVENTSAESGNYAITITYNELSCRGNQ